MKYKFIMLGIIMLSFNINTLFAQHQLKLLVIDEESKEPLIGATVYSKALDKGAVTNENGLVSIIDIPEGKHTFIVKFVGFETAQLALNFPLNLEEMPLTVNLHHDHEEMEEIVVQSTRSSRTIDDIPTRIEFIAGEELAEKGNMKPGDIRMLLNESTGIRTQQTSATSYNSSIRIQGLDGKYTQLLRDGLPLYSGFSGSLSLMQIAPLDLKQVEVIKGSNSTLYGGGAIAGLVNLISKDPEFDPALDIMLNATSALGFDASSFYANRNEKVGTTLFASYNKGTAYDPAGIGLTAIPEFDRYTLNPKLFLYPDEATRIELGVNMVRERRLGGNIDYIKGKTVTDPYYELNETDRLSSQFLLSHELSGAIDLSVKNSINYFDRSVEVPNYNFAGTQLSSFSEVNFKLQQKKAEWIAGINLWTDSFQQAQNSASADFSFEEYTSGAFLQNTYDVSESFVLEGGFRLDYNSIYGIFPLPRLSVMLKPAARLTIRLGGGLGYKTPTVFSEEAETRQFQNILPLDRSNLSAERSAGLNFDVNYSLAIGEELSITTNALLFYTEIQDPLSLAPVQNQFEFVQSNGSINSKGLEMNIKWSYGNFKLFNGYTLVDVNSMSAGEISDMPLVATHRLNNMLMYEQHGNFWIGLEGYYFSPQKLNDDTTGQDYWIVGLMTEKRFNKHFSVFLNFENFTDTRQTAFDTVYRGSLDDPQFRDIYAPVDGFVINGGIKLNLL